MAGMSRIPRSRGALTGVLLILLGAWGWLAPLVGPYIHYAYTPDSAWHFTLARVWLEILPGAAVVFGGALVMVSTRRLVAGAGAILAALGGGWFIAGRAVNALWPHLGVSGMPAGTSATRRVLEELGFFTGLGALIVFFAALALGRCSLATSQVAGSGPEPALAIDSLPADAPGEPGDFPPRDDAAAATDSEAAP